MQSPQRHRIGDLSRMFGITPRTLRYYEELGLLNPDHRGLNGNQGHRSYDDKDIIRLKRIQQLKDYGLSLAEIQELFRLAREDRSGRTVRTSLAEKYRVKLREAERRRDSLNRYIEDLSWHLEQLDKVEDFYQCPGKACKNCGWSERCDMRIAEDGRQAGGGSSVLRH